MGAPECRLENGDRGNSAGPAVFAGLPALNPRPARIRHIFMGRPAARPPGSASVCLRSRQTCSAVGKCLAPLLSPCAPGRKGEGCSSRPPIGKILLAGFGFESGAESLEKKFGRSKLRISVIGCGYVGLVTGTCLAEAGHQVVCTDNDPQRITALKAGVVPIYEPHLDAMLAANHRSQKLSFTSDAGEAVRAGEAIFICVGTPPLENGEADLSAIDNVARLIATEACESKLVVEKSTVPAQTGQQLKRVLEVYRRNGGVEFRVASNPEFLREGTAVEDFLHPDRIVFGVEDEVSERQLREIYRPILERKFRCSVHMNA